MGEFIKELRRREVFRTAGLYVGICWILIEAGSVILPSFGAPEWLVRGAIIVAIAGFPVMLLLAWFFDITEDGISAEVDSTDATTAPLGAGKTDFVIIGLLLLALVLSLALNVSQNQAPVSPEVAVTPVSVVLSSIQNTTVDASLDAVLVEALTTGIEVASHVDVLALSDPRSSTQQGHDLLLSVFLEPDDNGYRLSITGISQSGNVDAFDLDTNVASREALLASIGKLSERVRERLGDTSGDDQSTDAAQQFVAASLDAAVSFAAARQFERSGDLQRAVVAYTQAINTDPQFGLALSRLALAEWRLGKDDAAAAHWTRAQTLLPTITKRDQLETLTRYYEVGSIDYSQAVQAYAALIDQYPADVAVRNRYAQFSFRHLEFARAVEQANVILARFPTDIAQRSQLAKYAMYTGDWETASMAATTALPEDATDVELYVSIAMAAMASGDISGARDAYDRMENAVQNEHATSIATLGLADIDLYLGLNDAARARLTAGIDVDVANGDTQMAALKYVALAQLHTEASDSSAAMSAAWQAAQLSERIGVVVPAAIVFISAGDVESGSAIATTLSAKDDALSRAHGQMLQGMILEREGEPTQAILAMRDAVIVADSWLIRFQLGQAYLRAGNALQALDEMTLLSARSGEASAIFIDGMPTYRLLAQLPYWSGRVQQALNMQSAAIDHYQQFTTLRPQGSAMARDALERAASLAEK